MADFLSIQADKARLRKLGEIGRGGEAVVYWLREDTAAKVFLEPNDPFYEADENQKKAAEERIALMQTKLLEIPEELPSNVVVPKGILVDEKEKIFGYIMTLVKWCKNLSEVQKGKDRSWNTRWILLQLYDTLIELHKKEVVIGDLNENNILLDDEHRVKLVDVDSMQFGRYICPTFVPKFTPPELLNIDDIVSLKEKRTPLSDWYSFLVVAMHLLTNTDPYGGVFEKMTLPERIKERITVFDPRVRYPVNAIPLRSLKRPVLEIFFEAFYNDKRFVPDRTVFEEL